MDPKIAHAIKEIEAVYVGKDSAHGYYDPQHKVYVLVVRGQEAEAYHNAVKAIHELVIHARRLGNQKHP